MENGADRGNNNEGGVDGMPGISSTEILQLFMQERQQREAELEIERRRWEEEKRLREMELEQGRRRREDEVMRQEEQTRRQLDMMQSLVEGIRLQGEAATRRAERDKDVRVQKLTEEDDIVAYLTMFERLMVAYEVKKERWAFKLAPNLVGKAQIAYAALSAAEAGSYDKLKETILQRYDITEESYRQRFRATRSKRGESNRELVARLDDLANKWLESCTSVDEVKDKVVLEQFLSTLTEEVRVFIRERHPKTSKEAGKLADDFFQARKDDLRGQDDRKGSQGKSGDRFRRCIQCGKSGHTVGDCRMKSQVGGKASASARPYERPSSFDRACEKPSSFVRPYERPKKDLKDIECFNCHRKGHYSSNCPHRAMCCTERRVGYGGRSSVVKRPVVAKTEVVKHGMVEGCAVDNILLDTGCSRTLVHRKLVPEDKIQDAEAVAIRCAHGDTVLYPLAEITMEVEGRQIAVEAAVFDTLPMSVLLGTDTPELAELLEIGGSLETDEVFAVTTRSEKKKQKQEADEKYVKERKCGVHTHTLEADSLEWMKNMDNELFGKSNGKTRKTRKEKREERRRRERLQVDVMSDELDVTCPIEGSSQHELDATRPIEGSSQHELDVTAMEMKKLQATDSTLKDVREAVAIREAQEGMGFFSKSGLLYRRWIPPGRNSEEMAVEQLVLPKECRYTVMRVAHNIPLAGHLGKEKTTRRILQRFYWPTVHRDIAEFCQQCQVCQRTAGKRVVRAPLVPLPVISQPFERIAMDIIGPLPKSRRGHRYVLVVCDYATRYPEAVPMKYIDAASVAEELLQIFTRVGVPQEILTDQGANFTSQLLTELYSMLHVQPIRTTPYHPQTDGLVERFNQTLKGMLRKAAKDEGKDWDTLLPYLLFAYREVPQASTGFAPFELLYGHTVRGPLDILSEIWQANAKSKESVVSHVLEVRKRLEGMRELASENLQKAQERQKAWYDRNSREREFSPDDQVLLLLPSTTNKLMACWQGPYRIVKKIGKVNYLIEMQDHQKSRRVYHINLLKKWESTRATCGLAKEIREEEFPDWKAGESAQPAFGSHLSSDQKDEMKRILDEFQDVLQEKPGRTNAAEHTIETDSKPI